MPLTRAARELQNKLDNAFVQATERAVLDPRYIKAEKNLQNAKYIADLANGTLLIPDEDDLSVELKFRLSQSVKQLGKHLYMVYTPRAGNKAEKDVVAVHESLKEYKACANASTDKDSINKCLSQLVQSLETLLSNDWIVATEYYAMPYIWGLFWLFVSLACICFVTTVATLKNTTSMANWIQYWIPAPGGGSIIWPQLISVITSGQITVLRRSSGPDIYEWNANNYLRNIQTQLLTSNNTLFSTSTLAATTSIEYFLTLGTLASGGLIVSQYPLKKLAYYALTTIWRTLNFDIEVYKNALSVGRSLLGYFFVSILEETPQMTPRQAENVVDTYLEKYAKLYKAEDFKHTKELASLYQTLTFDVDSDNNIQIDDTVDPVATMSSNQETIEKGAASSNKKRKSRAIGTIDQDGKRIVRIT